jgi:hypothetical protein
MNKDVVFLGIRRLLALTPNFNWIFFSQHLVFF